MFSDRIVWRQLRCLPNSDLSAGMDKLGIHTSSASWLDICLKKFLIDRDSSSNNGFKNSMEFSFPSYLHYKIGGNFSKEVILFT